MPEDHFASLSEQFSYGMTIWTVAVGEGSGWAASRRAFRCLSGIIPRRIIDYQISGFDVTRLETELAIEL
jgi:hypothetical protein